MGFKSVSTRRTTATSAVSNQAVVVNTGTGSLSVAGSKITDATSITLGVVTPGQSAANSSVAVSGGPVISTITYLDANNNPTSANAVSTSGGNIKITGTGFVSGSSVYINNALVSNTFVSSTEIRAICPSASAGNVSILLFTPTDIGTQKVNAIRYSGAPSWVTSAVSLVNGTLSNVALSASSDSTITYTLQAGSTLPTGITLDSAGYLTGTPTGYSSNTLVTVVVIATDQEGQATQQTINISVVAGDDYFKYTTLLLNGETATPAFNKDSSTNNFNLVLNGAVTQSTMTPYTGYDTAGSMYVPSAVTNYLSLAHTTATTIVSGSTDSFIAECWVYFTSATASTAIMDQSGQNTVTFQNWSLNLDSAKKFQIIWGGTGSPGSQIGYISGTTVAASNTWYHLAYVKTNNVWSLFVNGTREATYTGLNTASDGTQNPLRIGSDTFSSQSINGYIADVRIYKGATADAPYNASSSTITVPTAPLTAITNTQLLTCQYNGGANNNGFIDSSTNKFPITRNGNATQGSFSPFSPTGWSNYFGGTSSLQTPASSITSILGTNGITSSSTFTIEAWIYQTQRQTYTTFPCMLGDMTPSSTINYFSFGPSSAGLLQTFWYDGGNKSVTGSTTIPLNTWTHIAISVSSGAIKMFVNGNLETLTGTTTLTNATGTTGYIAFGMENSGASGANAYFGYISNLRIVKSALYSETFAPSATPLTAVENTSLLTCQSNRFVDNSTNTFAISATGTPRVEAFSPFSPSATYSPATHGGSCYLRNATPDYLTITDSTLWNTGSVTPAFTVEAWVYPTNTTPGSCIISGAFQNSKVPYVIGMGNAAGVTATSNQVWFGYYSGGWSGVVSPSAIPLNAWTHVAGVYTGTAIYLYINGVSVATTTATWPAFNAVTTAGYIGKRWDGAGGGTNSFFGYMTDIRVVKGTALYTSNFTPPTAPLTAVANTQLLLNNTAASIVDAHSTTVLETVDNAGVSSAQKKYGSASLYFDGTGDYLSTGRLSMTAYDLVACDFTIEGWFYNSGAGAERYIFSQRGSGSGWELRINAANTVQFFYTGGSTLTTTGTITANTWTHIAVTRSGTTVRIFINGVQDSSTTFSNGSSAAASYPLYIGNSTSAGGGLFLGYMDDLRITRGFARYTANFTAPTSSFQGQ